MNRPTDRRSDDTTHYPTWDEIADLGDLLRERFEDLQRRGLPRQLLATCLLTYVAEDFARSYLEQQPTATAQGIALAFRAVAYGAGHRAGLCITAP